MGGGNMESLARARQLAWELHEGLNDPKRHEWGGPWEHLGDAERDVRVLLTGIKILEEMLDYYTGEGA